MPEQLWRQIRRDRVDDGGSVFGLDHDLKSFPMNHIGVPLQGPPNNSSFEYLRQTGRRSQPTNESTLLSTIKQALRGHAGEATNSIYNHWLPDDENPDGRELSWHTKQAVLSMGGVMVKKWSFWEDKENIQTACLGFLEQNALESRKSFSPSTNFTSVADDEGPPVGSGDPGGRPVFGPFGAREQRPRKFPDEHELIPAVFIFFRSVVRIYLQNGMSYVISIPFVVRKAWPISPHGVMIQRILEPAEQLEAELTGDPPLPTIFTITSPFAEPSAVGLASGISGGLDDKPVTLNEETTKNVLNSVPPTEMIVNITAGNTTSVCHRKNIVVSVDVVQHTLSIWRYAYAKPRQQQQQQEESSAAAARKKRQSMGNHARRTSAAFEGDRLDSKHHGPPKEPDLAALGAAASVAVATSMSSVIAGTQSTIPETEPIPTADERMTANYWMERIHSEQLTPER
jgi:anaphase-promoting complex subunit 1